MRYKANHRLLLTAGCVSRQRGFSLIEVLISLVILAIVVLGLIQVQSRSFMLTMQADRQMQAVQLLDNAAERYRVFDVDQRRAYLEQVAHLSEYATGQPMLTGYKQALTGMTGVCHDCQPAHYAKLAAINDASRAANAGVVLIVQPCASNVCLVASLTDSLAGRTEICQLASDCISMVLE